MRDTRDKLIDTTAALIEKQGYHATGLNQILEESGAPRGSLYYHFPDGKEELAAEAVRDREQRTCRNVEQRLSEIDDPVDAIYRFAMSLVAYVETSGHVGGAPFANVTLETASTSERLRITCRAAYGSIRELFEHKLSGAGYPADRARSLATLVTGAIDGAIILSRADGTSEPLRQTADELRALLECARPKP